MHDSACACCIASCSATPLMCVCVSAGLLKLGLVQLSQLPAAMVLLSEDQLDAQKEKGKKGQEKLKESDPFGFPGGHARLRRSQAPAKSLQRHSIETTFLLLVFIPKQHLEAPHLRRSQSPAKSLARRHSS